MLSTLLSPVKQLYNLSPRKIFSSPLDFPSATTSRAQPRRRPTLARKESSIILKSKRDDARKAYVKHQHQQKRKAGIIRQESTILGVPGAWPGSFYVPPPFPKTSTTSGATANDGEPTDIPSLLNSARTFFTCKDGAGGERLSKEDQIMLEELERLGREKEAKKEKGGKKTEKLDETKKEHEEKRASGKQREATGQPKVGNIKNGYGLGAGYGSRFDGASPKKPAAYSPRKATGFHATGGATGMKTTFPSTPYQSRRPFTTNSSPFATRTQPRPYPFFPSTPTKAQPNQPPFTSPKPNFGPYVRVGKARNLYETEDIQRKKVEEERKAKEERRRAVEEEQKRRWEQAKKAAEAERLQKEKEREEAKRRQQQREERKRQDPTSPSPLQQLFEVYEHKWSVLRSTPAPPSSALCPVEQQFHLAEVPWPLLVPPNSLDDFTPDRISSFLFHPDRPSLEGKSRKDILRIEMKRWHPDKFEPYVARRLLLPTGATHEDAMEISKAVTRALGKIMLGPNPS